MNTARVLVIGGGNLGASVLYHLALAGWTDCVLMEKAELTSGATWHAAGLVSRMVGSHSLGHCHDYAVDLYKKIEKDTGQSVSWHISGSLRLAGSEAHRDWLMHTRDVVLARDQQCDWLSPEEVKALNPLVDTQHIVGAIHTPDDGHVDPYGACQAMAKGARQLGARIERRNRVLALVQRPSGEWEVTTEQGVWIAQHVVNAAGYHAKQVAALSGLALPIVSLQHHYLITDEVPEFADMGHEIPVTRDDFFTGYVRREQASALIGLYDTHDALVRWPEGCPWDSENELFEADWGRITPWLEKCFERFPALAQRGIKRIVNGAITYTPDGSPLVGPAPGLKNYWLACGATVGIAWGPGLGRALAEWIIHGGASIATRSIDPRRFSQRINTSVATARARENYMTRLSLPHPQDQYLSERGRLRSTVHSRTTALGAVFEEVGDWERPKLYGPSSWGGHEPKAWRRGDSHAQARAEAQAVHHGVGLGDFSAFAQFHLSGAGVEDFLNRLCANRLPKKVGASCLTLLLNARGRIEGEATLVRLAPDAFWLVTGGPSEQRIWDWLTVHQRGDEVVNFQNCTQDYGVLLVAGPKANALLCACSESQDQWQFPWRHGQTVQVAGESALALRMSYSGLPAWELHLKQSAMLTVWDALWRAGQAHDITAFGSQALDMMRIEKHYAGGHELSNDVTPLEAGQQRFVDFDKDFLGREALLAESESPAFTLVLLRLIDTPCDVRGGEGVYSQNKRIGVVSSGTQGASHGESLAFAYLNTPLSGDTDNLTIMIFGEHCVAERCDCARFDPENTLLKTALNEEAAQ